MKRLLPLLCCSLSALANAQIAPSTTPTTATQCGLANGLTVIVQPDHRAPTAVQMLWVRVGAMDEVDGTSGVAHILEHMLFKGTPSLAPGEFSRRVAALGGRENAFTAKDNTGYYQQIPAAKLEAVMQLEADRFAHNQWSDDEFKRELEVVKEERRMRVEDSPRSLMHEALTATVFTASPYRRPVVGWMSDLEAMTADDARAFYQRWYVPANAALVVAGDVEPAQVCALAQKHYGSIPARAVPARKPRLEPQQVGIRRLDYKAPAEQAYVALAFKVPKLAEDNDDALALTVLAAVLDGYSGARLERALTQDRGQAGGPVADSAGAYNGLVGRGPQLFMLDGVPAAGRTTEQVEAALRSQVALVAQNGVTEAELSRVKTQWVSNAVYKLDSVFNQARELGSNWVQGLPLDANDRLIARLRGITAAQVQAVAARYFGDDQLTVAALRPQPLDPNRPKKRPLPTGELR
nr:pitrilysin family protein [uncultured Albidiferax sp.]